MKRTLLILAFISCAASAFAQTPAQRDTIAVTGFGRTSVTPDRVTFNCDTASGGVASIRRPPMFFSRVLGTPIANSWIWLPRAKHCRASTSAFGCERA